MPKAISCIPHKQRMDAHRVDYLKAISTAMDYPFQSEDGREPSPIHIKLEEQCKKYTGINNWLFTNCCTDSLQIAFQTLCDIGDGVANAAKFLKDGFENITGIDIDDTLSAIGDGVVAAAKTLHDGFENITGINLSETFSSIKDSVLCAFDDIEIPSFADIGDKIKDIGGKIGDNFLDGPNQLVIFFLELVRRNLQAV